MNPYINSFGNSWPWSLASGSGMASNTTSFMYPQAQMQTTGLGGLGYPYGIATTAPIEREHKIEVPVINKEDKAGIFLRAEDGSLVHVPADKLYKAFLEW